MESGHLPSLGIDQTDSIEPAAAPKNAPLA